MILGNILRACLTGTMALRLKQALRDVGWILRCVHVDNPPLPPAVRSVLFVCLGNICRSPFAAGLAGKRAGAAGVPSLVFHSAGIRPSQDGTPPPEAVAAAGAFGVDLSTHTPSALNGEAMAAHDLVLVMDVEQLRHLAREFPTERHRMYLLPLFDLKRSFGETRFNIRDPYGLPPSVYLACYQRIDRAVDGLLRAVRPPSPARQPSQARHSTVTPPTDP